MVAERNRLRSEVTLLRSFAVLACLACVPAAARDDNPRLFGVWKLVTDEVEFQDTHEHAFPFGKEPNGYLILTSAAE